MRVRRASSAARQPGQLPADRVAQRVEPLPRLGGDAERVRVGAAQAGELTIGRATEPTSIDPLFARTGNNQMTAEHIFDRLVVFDENLQVRPGIAASWQVVDPLIWEVKLRDGVSFHDGSPLTSEDVLFALKRAATVANSPAPFTGAVAAIASTEALDPQTVIIR